MTRKIKTKWIIYFNISSLESRYTNGNLNSNLNGSGGTTNVFNNLKVAGNIEIDNPFGLNFAGQNTISVTGTELGGSAPTNFVGNLLVSVNGTQYKMPLYL